MDPTTPPRPRLADHVTARRHLVDGADLVVLQDLHSGRLVQIGLREWQVLAAADGTRDVEGVLLAARREGAHALAPAVETFFQQLHAAGMLAEPAVIPATKETSEASRDAESSAGAAGDQASPGGDAGATGHPHAGDEAGGEVDDQAARPLDPLAAFGLTCDGSGGCCRFYATILFSQVETARARAFQPGVLGAGDRHERAFMPERGIGPTGGAAVVLCNGRCAYLGDNDRCSIHEAGGAAAKPLGCNTYPATFVDDGEVVRVSVAVECACVLASAGREGGSSLVPRGARVRADLHASLEISVLPALVQVSPTLMAPRAELRAWSRRVGALPPSRDTAAALVALGAAVAAGGLASDPAPSFADPAPIAPAAVRPLIEALHARAVRRHREDEGWRSPRDLVRRAAGWIAAATGALLDPAALASLLAAPAPAPRSEAFYVRAALHGHQLVGPVPLSLALRERAVRLLVARALPQVFAAQPEGELDPSCAHPLALLEAMLRGYALDGYAEDVAE